MRGKKDATTFFFNCSLFHAKIDLQTSYIYTYIYIYIYIYI